MEDELLEEATKALKSLKSSNTVEQKVSDDPDDVFGKYIANELRLIKDFRVKQFVKHKIQNIIFESQFQCQNQNQSFTQYQPYENAHPYYPTASTSYPTSYQNQPLEGDVPSQDQGGMVYTNL